MPHTCEIILSASRESNFSAMFKRLDASGKTGRGADSTATISEDREDQA
jgi:hypothetical protein